MKRILSIILLTFFLVGSNAFLTDINISQKLGAYSLASYCSASKLYNWSCGLTCSRVNNLQNLQIVSSDLNSMAMIGYSAQDDAIVIAVRGTVPWSAKNWISDIKTYKIQYNSCVGCSVHYGFYEAMQSIFTKVALSFNTLKRTYPNSKVYLTGHSLGGAIATLLAPEIYKLNGNKPIDAFYTMGSPRVGNSKFSEWFKNNNNFSLLSGRVTKNRDPVVQVPPNLIPFGFSHIGNEIFYKSSQNVNSFTMCEKPEDRNCSYGMLIAANIMDHQTYFDWNWAVEQIECQ